MKPPEKKVAWTEIERINRSDRQRDKNALFNSKIKELTHRNAKMEEFLYEVHAVSKMTSFVEALEEEKPKKNKGCTIL